MVSTNSISHEERLESLRLVRSRSNSSSFSGTGYLFLAIVFCMMCCSSIVSYPMVAFKSAFNAPQMSKAGSSTFGRKLMFDNFSKPQSNSLSQSLSEPLDDEDVVMTEVEEEKPNGALDFVRMMLYGQYTYLTYFILSSTCFFFWLTPNCHKFRSLYFNKKEHTTQYIPSGRRSHANRSQSPV